MEKRKNVFYPEGESKTKQSFAKGANINNIIGKFKRTGVLGTPGTQRKPFYGDFQQGTDFYEARNAVIEVENNFMALPAKVRSRFKNNPEDLLDFLSSEENRDEAIELGLIAKPEGWVHPDKRTELSENVQEEG